MKPAGRAHAPWDEFLLLCFFLSHFIFFLYNIIAEIKTGCRRIIHFIVCNDFWLPCWFLCTDSRMCTRAALTALCACFPDEETPGLYGFLHVIVHSAKGFEQSASKSARNSFFFFFFFSSNCTCAHTPAQHLLTHSGCAYTCLPAKHMTQLIITAGTCSFHHHMAKMQRKEKSRERGREWGCLRGSVEAKVGFLRLFSLSRHHKWQRCWRHIEKEERQNHKQQHSEVDSWQL